MLRIDGLISKTFRIICSRQVVHSVVDQAEVAAV